MVHGEIWTIKELFVYPNEYIYWSIQIVMYPFMTGLVAGAFVLSSLYHVFGIKQLKDMARFALVFSFALLFVAPMPLLLHLMQPLRGINVLMTPHFTSAIAAFGIVFMTYGAIVASELWFLYRRHFVEVSLALRQKPDKTMTRAGQLSAVQRADPRGIRSQREGAAQRREGDQDPRRHRHPRRLLPPRLRRLHLRLGQGERPVDDAADAGHLHHVGDRVGHRTLHAHLHRHHGDQEVPRLPQERRTRQLSLATGDQGTTRSTSSG